MSSDILDPRRLPRKTKALKADRTVHRITFNPSSAKSGETLYVTMPKLVEGMVFVPYSTFLRFNLTIEMGQANNTVVQKVGRNLVKNFKVIFEGKTIADVERADLYGAYHDMVTCEEDMMMGLTTENYRKLRTAAGDATSNANEFIMPHVTDVSVTIDDVPHKLFSDGMKSTDLWKSIKQKVGYDKRLHGHFKEPDFHNDKFALWVDLRASPDNWLHGDGLIVGRSKEGVRLEISWTERNGVVVNCYAFVVADAALFVNDGRVKQFFLQPSSSD